jgi:hypothetical protein
MFGLNEIQINKNQEQAVVALLEERAQIASLRASEEHNPSVDFSVGFHELQKLLVASGRVTLGGVENRWSQRPTFHLVGKANDLIELLGAIRSDASKDAGVKRSATVALNKILVSTEQSRQSTQSHARRLGFSLLDGQAMGRLGLRGLVERHNVIVQNKAFLDNNQWNFVEVPLGNQVLLMVGGEQFASIATELQVQGENIKVVWRVLPSNRWNSSFGVLTGIIANDLSWDTPLVVTSRVEEIISVTKDEIARKVEAILIKTDQQIETQLSLIHSELGLPIEIVSPQMAVA